MERSKNIEVKNEKQLNNQLEMVRNKIINNVQKESLNRLKFLGNISQNAKEKYNEIKKMDKTIDYDKLVCSRTMGRFITLPFLEG